MPAAAERTYSIGEVVALLQPDYDVSVSNLRFWEKEGLLSPKRTAGGHRLYSSDDVARIRWIKRLQANRYLPLAAIKHVLGSAPSEPLEALATSLDTLFRPQHYDAAFQPLDAASLATATGLDLATVATLTAAGLLYPSVPPDPEAAEAEGPARYDEDDQQIGRLIAEGMQLGMGLPHHLARAALIQQFVTAEWTTLYQPHTAKIEAMPLTTRLRFKELMESLEALLFSKARRRLHDDLMRHGRLADSSSPNEES